MSLTSKLVAGTLVGAGLYAGYNYYVNMKKTQAELEVVPEASIDSVNLSGITIRLDLLLKNPTKGNFKMKFPFIKIKYMSGLNVSPNERYYNLGGVTPGNFKLKVEYKDTPDSRLAFVAYRVSIYLDVEVKE